MKKLVSLLLALVFVFALASCGKETDDTVIRVGTLAGPTGMGMAKLISDNPEYCEFTVSSAPDAAINALAAGEVDMICLPTNTAATLALRKDDYITVLCVNCLGSLYLLTDDTVEVNSFADLEGLTITTSVPGSTTGPILSYLLEKNGVNATVETETDHDALVARLARGDVHVAVLPEPKVSAALLSAAGGYHVALNLSEEWDKVSDHKLAMGALVVRNAFLAEHKALVNRFLADYEASIEYIAAPANRDSAADMIVAAGILPKAPIAKSALANLDGAIVYLDGNEMKAALVGFYDAIEQAKPADVFYYPGK